MEKYKPKLIVCGNVENRNVRDPFPRVVDFTVSKLLLRVTLQRNYIVMHFDFEKAFFKETPERPVYAEFSTQLFYGERKPEKAMTHLKSLHGLTEASNVCYERITRKFVDVK